MKLNFTKKKAALTVGGVLIASAIGAGSYFALNKRKADNDMFAMNIPKTEVKAQPTPQQASVPASTPIASQPIAEAPKAIPKRWQDMTFKECMVYNDEYNLQHLKKIDATKDGMQALNEMEAYKPPHCYDLPDAPNKLGKVPAPQQEQAPVTRPVEDVKPTSVATPTASPEIHKAEKRVKKVHVEAHHEAAPTVHSSQVQPTPQPATKAWYQ
ncbi:hypothetical protein [Burkholderia sp. LMG 13014]|uniref:hypothetical protein n=1 Tax=Burkholderia sp. LMG 13014 TaxID=2709306 RepID=UPI0019629E8D|nr:hypothetical protein [Burkholderia sp. LMG 13014]